MEVTPGPWGLARHFEHLTTPLLLGFAHVANWDFVVQDRLTLDKPTRWLAGLEENFEGEGPLEQQAHGSGFS